MALTAAQRNAVFEALEVPDSTSYNVLSGPGTLTSGVDQAAQASATAKTAIDAALATIAADAGKQALLAARCDEWNACSGNTMTVQAGRLGNIEGANIDPDKQRKRIADRIKIMVPFYRYHEIIMKQYENGSVNSIPIYR